MSTCSVTFSGTSKMIICYVCLYLCLNLIVCSGRFPVGVSKYLFWPGTTWANRVTSSHHLWTIPLVTWTTGGVHPLALPLSFFVVVTSVSLSRLMTPRSIICGKGERYLNLNLCHELWSDIEMEWLRFGEDRIPYLVRLFIAWSCCNAAVYCLLSALSSFAFPAPPTLCK